MVNGVWYVVSPPWMMRACCWVARQTHEVIGNPPNVAVPTHFAKVILASKPLSPQTPEKLEVSSGAFVLPNAVISNETPLTSFVVPGMSDQSWLNHSHVIFCGTVDAVERAAGLTLFSDEIKSGSKHLCQTTKCEVVVRRFDEARKNTKQIAAPKS